MSAIATLTSGESGANSLTDINSNFAALNSDKLETSTATSLYAPIVSPTFTGTPSAPTPGSNDNDTSIATTAFVSSSVVTLSNKTLSGQTALADAATISITVPTADGTATGLTTAAFNCGYSSSAIGDLVYLDSSATWQKADANTLALYNGLLAIALQVKSSGQALSVALPGSIVYATGFPTFTIGSPVYMSETAGAITGTAPTTTDAATRVIGWGVHADKLYFFPSPNYITHV